MTTPFKVFDPLKKLVPLGGNQQFVQNMFTCVATYAVLGLYCVLFYLSNAPEPSTEDVSLINYQFIFDAFFPSTLAIVISIIIQNIIELAKRRGVHWLLTGVLILLAIGYTMVCANLRALRSETQFYVLMGSTAVIVVFSYISYAQLLLTSEQDGLGISATQ